MFSTFLKKKKIFFEKVDEKLIFLYSKPTKKNSNFLHKKIF